MKLIRFGNPDKEKPGVLLGDRLYDVSAFAEDYNESFFENYGISGLTKFIEANKSSLPEIPAGARLGSPVARPSKIVCIGLNYADHARETGATPPKEPVIFLKSTTALTGPYDNIVIPQSSKKT